MMMMKSHYYMSLLSSPWPLMSSIFSMNLFFSFFLFFSISSLFPLLMSLFLLVLVSYQWWRDLDFEYIYEGMSSELLDSCLKYSMILFISSEIFFFISFFWGYFHFFFSDLLEMGWMWHPAGLLMFDYSNVPLINTIILLSSGMTITMAHNYYLKNSYSFSLFYMFFTLSLGAFFTFLQYLEYCSSFFSIIDSSFGSVFFMLTGFHGIHVLVGSIFIFFVLIRSMKMFLSTDSMISLDLCSWYWHFVDVVWMFLYYFVYYLSF